MSSTRPSTSMAGIPSIGDVLMLSQLAWKIGRAFTAGRRAAPQEFVEVEREVNGLAKALKLLAEALFADSDDSLIARADRDTQFGIATILLSAKQTLNDLDSLLDSYQVIRKHRTSGGYSVERSWSDLVLTTYKTMMWTTEGGNIHTLRNMLHMHTSTILLTMQALQSKSLSRLEKVVMPVAEKIDVIHVSTGDLSLRLQEIQHIVITVAGGTPVVPPGQSSSRPSSGYDVEAPSPSSLRLQTFPSRNDSRSFPQPYSSLPRQEMSFRKQSAQSLESMSYTSSDDGSWRGPSTPSSSRSPSLRGRVPKRNTYDFPLVADGQVIDEYPEVQEFQRMRNLQSAQELQRMTETQVIASHPVYLQPLPPPSLPPPPDPGSDTASVLSQAISLTSTLQSPMNPLTRTATAMSQLSVFERAAFSNSAILCDVRAARVEYTQKKKEDPEDPMGIELVEAMTDCRICVVRKRETLADDVVRLITSIWAFSDDDTVRMQQELEDGVQYIPYSSYFSPEKIAVTIPAELKFHDKKYGSRLRQIAKTTWVNYVFADAEGAALFQNELFGLTLVALYRTDKTLRVHEGIAGVIAYQEQMCGMENLRLWEDGATGGIVAMIHFSAQFRNGYLAFYLNNSSCPVRVKDEGGKEVKIKGLRFRLDKRRDSAATEIPPPGKKLDPKKWLTGARVEFASEVEKVEFLNKVKEVQKVMNALPDLSGVW